MPLLALDVEDTILFYDYSQEIKPGLFKPLIDKNLKVLLKQFHDADWIIVLASSTDNERTKDQKLKFLAAGFHGYINDYMPPNPKYNLSKFEMLNQYAAKYKIDNKDVYFYDDKKKNIDEAIANGYPSENMKVVNNDLANQLSLLSKKLEVSEQKPGLSIARCFGR